jgi:hypothetical protein
MTKFYIYIFILAVLTFSILLPIHKMQENEKENISPAVAEFQDWKKDFNLESPKTYIDCLNSQDTFKTLYCNMKFSEHYKRRVDFS